MAFAVTERARVSYAGDAAEPMDVENARAATSSYDPTATVEDDPTREIVLAAYRGDVARVSRVLRRCGADAPLAEMSLTRADALTLLGENVYLGSHSWSTQEGFPVMYFAGERSEHRIPPRRRVNSRVAGREIQPTVLVSRTTTTQQERRFLHVLTVRPFCVFPRKNRELFFSRPFPALPRATTSRTRALGGGPAPPNPAPTIAGGRFDASPSSRGLGDGRVSAAGALSERERCWPREVAARNACLAPVRRFFSLFPRMLRGSF